MAEDDIILSELSDEELVQQMHDDLYDGLKEEIEEGTNILLERGWAPYDILTQALVEGMRIVGVDFRDGILFVPEVLLSANAMKAGMTILRPLLIATGAPRLLGSETLTAQFFLPAGPKPAMGWPVAIFGHGFTDSMYGAPWTVASVLASQGIATVSINVVGHGGGALGTLNALPTVGAPVQIPAGGRGIDQDGNGSIDSTEGVNAAAPQTIVSSRDVAAILTRAASIPDDVAANWVGQAHRMLRAEHVPLLDAAARIDLRLLRSRLRRPCTKCYSAKRYSASNDR